MSARSYSYNKVTKVTVMSYTKKCGCSVHIHRKGKKKWTTEDADCRECKSEQAEANWDGYCDYMYECRKDSKFEN